jgi:hypothetical protein
MSSVLAKAMLSRSKEDWPAGLQLDSAAAAAGTDANGWLHTVPMSGILVVQCPVQ